MSPDVSGLVFLLFYSREVSVLNSIEEPVLEEITKGAEFHPHVQIVQSVRHYTNHKPPHDQGIVNRISLKVTDIHVRRIDPHRLLGCYLKDYRNNEKIILTMVYETHIAGKFEMSLSISSKYNASKNAYIANFVARNCPLAYRFVEIEVSKKGVITDVHFRPQLHHKIRCNMSTLRRLWNRQEKYVKSPKKSSNRPQVQRVALLLPTIITRNKLMMAHLNGRYPGTNCHANNDIPSTCITIDSN